MKALWYALDVIAVVGFAICVGCSGDGIPLQEMDATNGAWSHPRMASEAEILDIRRQANHGPGTTLVYHNTGAWSWDCGFNSHAWTYNIPYAREVTLRTGYNLTGGCKAVKCDEWMPNCYINFTDIYLNDMVQSHWTWSGGPGAGTMAVTFTTGINGTHDQENPHAPSRYVLPVATPTQPDLTVYNWKECVPWVWNASSMIIANANPTPDVGDKTGPPPGSGPCWSD